jgi:hypothetical protein
MWARAGPMRRAVDLSSARDLVISRVHHRAQSGRMERDLPMIRFSSRRWLSCAAATALLGGAGCAGSPPPTVTSAHVDRVPTGGPHDFDYFDGAWTTMQHRL